MCHESPHLLVRCCAPQWPGLLVSGHGNPLWLSLCCLRRANSGRIVFRSTGHRHAAKRCGGDRVPLRKGRKVYPILQGRQARARSWRVRSPGNFTFDPPVVNVLACIPVACRQVWASCHGLVGRCLLTERIRLEPEVACSTNQVLVVRVDPRIAVPARAGQVQSVERTNKGTRREDTRRLLGGGH